MQTNYLIDHLFNILEDLHEKEEQINQVLEQLGASDPSTELLARVLEQTQIALVIALGGTKEHWEYIDSDFFGPFYAFQEGNIEREQLLEIVKEVIDEDLKGEVPINFVKR